MSTVERPDRTVALVDYDTGQVHDSTNPLPVTLTDSPVMQEEDTPHSSGDKGFVLLAVRNDIPGSLVDADGDYAPVQVNENGEVRVTTAAGGGGGSTGQADKSAFTEGTTTCQPIAGVVNESAVSDPTEDKAAAVRITTKRGLHTNLRDSTGTEIGTASAPLRTDPTGTTAQPVTDNGGSLTVDGAVSVSGSVTVADGGGSLSVDDNGSTLSVDDGGGSITVDGTVATTAADGSDGALGATTDAEASGNGTVIALLKRLRTLFAAGLPAALVSGRLDVNVGASTTVTVQDGGGSISVDDNGTTLSIDDGAGSITVDSSDGSIATLGTTTDVEASGDGSLIAIVKRLRTLLSGGLPAALVSGRLDVNVGNTPTVTANQGGSWTVDTELPAAAALSDTIANPTAPAVGAHLMIWDSGGAVWKRAQTESSAQTSLRTTVYAGGNRADVLLPLDTNSGTLGLATTTQNTIYNPTTGFWERQRTANAVDNTSGTGVPASGNMLWSASDVKWFRQAGDSSGYTLVDTELPAAVALSDVLANPTTPLVGGCHLIFSSVTGQWLRAYSQASVEAGGTTDHLAVHTFVKDNVGNTHKRQTSSRSYGDGDTGDSFGPVSLMVRNGATTYDPLHQANAADNTTGTGVPAAGNMLWDGSTKWFRQAGNSSGYALVDTELPAAAALSDSTANPTAPAVGAHLMIWDTTGNVWKRAMVESSAQTSLRTTVYAGGNRADVMLPLDTNSGTLGLVTTTQNTFYNPSTGFWERARTANAADNTSGTGVPAAGNMLYSASDVKWFRQAGDAQGCAQVVLRDTLGAAFGTSSNPFYIYLPYITFEGVNHTLVHDLKLKRQLQSIELVLMEIRDQLKGTN